MLIRNAEVWGFGPADVRIDGGRIASFGPSPSGEGLGWGMSPNAAPAEKAPPPTPPLKERGFVIDAMGGALLPGLHDHHIHLAGLAARAASVWCGPPDVENAEELAARLATHLGEGWLRGIGYHESVMGLPDARALDRLLAHRPLRIQQRSGRMWLLNSLALDHLLARAAPPPGLEREGGRFTGRLFDEDAWLRAALASVPPSFGEVSATLVRHGVTGVTDMSPRNSTTIAAHFAAQQSGGMLRQHCWLAGELSLAGVPSRPWQLGPAKLHLHEAALPGIDEATSFIAAAHGQARAVAIHCVTEVELVFALATLEAAGVAPGDRIEHAAIADPDHIARIAGLGLAVCVQPHFIDERGDAYLRDVEPRHLGDLYRLASLAAAGIALAGGSDAPFASADPWAAMRAAASRRTREGRIVGAGEALSPEAALALYCADPADLTRQRRIAVGETADLCLLARPWSEARTRLTSDDVRATIIAGHLVHDSIDQPPGERGSRRNPAA